MDRKLATLYAEIDRLDFVAFMERMGIRPSRKIEQYVCYRCRQLCYRSSFLAIDTTRNICFRVYPGLNKLQKPADHLRLINDQSDCCMGVLVFAHQYFRQDPKTIALHREKYQLIGPSVPVPEATPVP
jgi:hypothetical protein